MRPTKMSVLRFVHGGRLVIVGCAALFLSSLFCTVARADDAPAHPRLFFTRNDVPRLRQEARTTHAAIARNIIRQADAILQKPVPPYPKKPDYNAFTDPTGLPIPVAMAWVLTGDRKYLDRTREYLVSFARWPHWGNERAVGQRDYALAWMLRACAVAYDWTWNDLSPDDRTLIRDALARHAQEVYEAAAVPKYNAEWQNWWRTSYVQNHWHHCVFPLGLAALVLDGEDPRAARWLDFAIGSARLTSDVLHGIGDGTWHEGPHYQDGMIGTILPFYLNLQRLKQIDLLDEGYMRNYALWKVYSAIPGAPRAGLLRYSSFVPQWGGCIVGGGHANLRFIASRYKDGHAQWLADRIVEKEPQLAETFEFFYYDPSVAAVAPDDLPLDHTFSDLAGVIWRTGWGDDDLAFALKTSAYGGKWVYEQVSNKRPPFDEKTDGSLNAGHDHADANTFSLFWGRFELAGELPDRIVIGQQGGIGNSTAAHNTLLVDGKGQVGPRPSGDRFGDQTDGRLDLVCAAGRFSYLVADATNRYRTVGDKGEPGDRLLGEFRRHVLFAKPRYLVMVDSVRADKPHQYEWLCHLVDDAPPDRVTVADGWVRSPAAEIRPGRPWSDTPAADARVLGIRLLAPPDVRHEATLSRYFTTFRPPKHKVCVKLSPPAPVADVRFVTVLFPMKAADWDTRPAVTLIADSARSVGVRVALDGPQDHLLSLTDDAETAVGEYRLSGRAASIIRDSKGGLSRIFVAQGTRLVDQDSRRVLLQADRPTTVEIVYSDSSLSLTGEAIPGLKVFAPGVDAQHITVNGKPTSAANAGITLIP